MPAVAPRAQRAAARLRGAAAPPPPTATKRVRPPTADSSPLPRPSSRTITIPDGTQRSPTKRSRITASTPEEPTTPPPATAPATPNGRAAYPTTPLTSNIPADVVNICAIPGTYTDTFSAALSIVHEADPRTGTAFDAILQKLFYTITSQALCLAASPPPATTPSPATMPVQTNAPTNNTDSCPPPSYASKAAAAAPAQTTPWSKQTIAHSNTEATRPPPHVLDTTATKPPPRDEVILHTSQMTSPPTNAVIIEAVTAAAEGRTPATAVRQLPSGDCAVIFPGGTDRWYIKDLSWVTCLGTTAIVCARG